MIRWLCLALLAVVPAGCGKSTPLENRPPPGAVWIYDGVRLVSTDRGEQFAEAEFNSNAQLESVELVLADGFAIAPLQVNAEILRQHKLDSNVLDDDGAGNFRLSVWTSPSSNISILFKSNAIEQLKLSGSPASKIQFRIRGKQIPVPVRGAELKQLLGEPDSVEEFSIYQPVH